MKKKISTIATFIFASFFTIKGQGHMNSIYHYSILDALRNGSYYGDLPVSQLSKKGDFGLGTYNYLDGEMVVLDGVFYRVSSDGLVRKAELERKVPFASVTLFKADSEFEITDITDVGALQDAILKKLPSLNRPYAVRIDGIFKTITVGAAYKVDESLTTGLAELMKTRPLFRKENISGTMIGFYTPPYGSSIDLSPFHFHFISNDRTYGGHLISAEFSPIKVKVSLDEKSGYEIELPNKSESFDKKWLQYSKSKSTY